ncbi:MAG: DUF2764 domain-containing protein [Bacteroidaceae bacterium]|nr:DUF2764 domain-containing protein [Bacteroidaceae bacterium]
MGSYYYLMTDVPVLTLDGENTGISYADFRLMCKEQLSKSDMRLLYCVYLRQDCLNLLKLLKNPEAEIKVLGNYTIEELLKLIEECNYDDSKIVGYPSFLPKFLMDSYYVKKDMPGYFAEDDLMMAYYEYAFQRKNKFVVKWFKINFNITNILTALIARKNGWNVADYVLGDNEITEMMRMNKSKDFDLGREYDYVPELMKIVDIADPVEKEKRIDAFKWIWLDEQTFCDPFSIETVFAYLCKLEMLDRWEKLDPVKGKETFREIIENLRGEAKVPEEFTK